MSYLIGFVFKECLGIARDKKTSRDIWKAFEDTCGEKSVFCKSDTAMETAGETSNKGGNFNAASFSAIR